MISRFSDSEKLVLKHWTHALAIIRKVNSVEGCSEQEEENVDLLLTEMIRLIQTNVSAWVVRKLLLDQMINELAADNILFTDTLLKLADNICLTQMEKRYLAAQLAQLDDRFFHHEAVKIFIELGDLFSAIRIKKANLETDYNYVELARLYEQIGDCRTALQICLKGLDQHQGRRDSIYKYLFDCCADRK
jgi:hypothetical protein